MIFFVLGSVVINATRLFSPSHTRRSSCPRSCRPGVPLRVLFDHAKIFRCVCFHSRSLDHHATPPAQMNLRTCGDGGENMPETDDCRRDQEAFTKKYAALSGQMSNCLSLQIDIQHLLRMRHLLLLPPFRIQRDHMSLPSGFMISMVSPPRICSAVRSAQKPSFTSRQSQGIYIFFHTKVFAVVDLCDYSSGFPK